jgi:lycopene beta-cyclase
MPTLVYDIAIIGAGASGLQLLYEYIQANPTKEKKILLLDSGDRSKKSWCFWAEKEHDCFPFLVEKSWNSMTYTTSHGETKKSPINPLEYHYISSDRFFQYFFNEFIPANEQIDLVKSWVKVVNEGEELQSITCQDGSTFFSKRVADSRPPAAKENSATVYQHFSGKFIEFEEPILDDSAMTLMDFSLPASSRDMAVFHYILPFSRTKALIETTVFTQLSYDKNAYESIWQKYVDAQFKGKKFKLLSNETGTIPMGAQIRKKEGNVFQIGAAGGNMKASTGYAFTRMLKDAKYRVTNRLQVTPGRFHFYDKMLLKIMTNDMAKIPEVMDRLFTRVPKKDILCFLDDKTTLVQEVKLLAQLDIPLFIKHLIR